MILDGNFGGGSPIVNIAAPSAEQSAEMTQNEFAIAEIAASFAIGTLASCIHLGRVEPEESSESSGQSLTDFPQNT